MRTNENIQQVLNLPSITNKYKTVLHIKGAQKKLTITNKITGNKKECRALAPTKGAMRGIIAVEPASIDELKEKLDAYPGLVGRDLVCTVTGREVLMWKDFGRVR